VLVQQGGGKVNVSTVYLWQGLVNEVVPFQTRGQIAKAHVFFQQDSQVFRFPLVVHGLAPP
jgi:hypothetical protein